MEGPTPVSALIHAATMVTAGVYMVGRNAVLFSHAPMTMEIVAIVGVLTALMAASIGLVQTDIKRVLAYSTVSQLGYMFLAMGVGAFAAGAFHLMTHAFFKALLFLGSGSVIHAMAGEQDMRKMGGLKKYLPVTFWTMLIGTLAIAGIPPLAGFFSKDEILLPDVPRATRLIWALAVVDRADDGVLHVPPDVADLLRRLPRARRGRRRGARRTARRTAPAHGAARTAAIDGHGGHGAWHGPHESPQADDRAAGGAGRRRDRRRVRRHPGGARRRQRDRALPRAELRGARAGDARGRRRGGHAGRAAADGQPRARRSAAEARGAGRRRARRPRMSHARRARPDGASRC